VGQAWEGLLGAKPVAGPPRTVGKGTASLALNLDAAMAQLRQVLPPDFEIREPAGAARATAVRDVGFLHRRQGAVDLYFVANVSVGHRAPERLDPETGRSTTSVVYDYLTEGPRRLTELQLHLDPFESCFVAFGSAARPPLIKRTTGWPETIEIARKGSRVEVAGLVSANGPRSVVLADGRTHRLEVSDVPRPLDVAGPWTLAFGKTAPASLPSLVSWTDLPAGRNYSGWATYQTELEVAALPSEVEWVLDLGTVFETAEVVLNGVPLGAAWKGLRRLPCGQALRIGRNLLQVDVANLWINNMVSRPAVDYSALEETFGIRWGRYGEVKPEKLPPAGLLGPVRLLPLRRMTVSI
jgi:hypothetical protein